MDQEKIRWMKILFCYRFALLEVRRTSVAALLSGFIILCWVDIVYHLLLPQDRWVYEFIIMDYGLWVINMVMVIC